MAQQIYVTVYCIQECLQKAAGEGDGALKNVFIFVFLHTQLADLLIFNGPLNSVNNSI